MDNLQQQALRLEHIAYNVCMRFEVPQFIEIEDKIFGPFTWKQFVYLGGGIGLAAVIFFTMPFLLRLLLLCKIKKSHSINEVAERCRLGHPD